MWILIAGALWCIITVGVNYRYELRKQRWLQAHWNIQHHIAGDKDYEIINGGA